MISEALVIEFALLVALYFKYFFNVIFISYNLNYWDYLEYHNITAELQKRLPEYTVNCGWIKPPDVFLLVLILALEFFFEGLYNLIGKFFAKGKIVRLIVGLSFLLIFSSLLEDKNVFRISFEGHTLYLDESPDLNVDNLVDIIKENTKELTFPRGVALAGLFYGILSMEPNRRRR